MSIAIFLNWFFNFVVTISYPYIDVNEELFFLDFFYAYFILKKAIGNYSFVIYGIFLLIFIGFTYFEVPETNNKSIEEITLHFEKPRIYNNSKEKLDTSNNTIAI